MKYEFRLELYEFNNPEGVDMLTSPVSVVNGTADSEDIKIALDYLLKLKEKRYTNETS
jgi:hypothetical protein